MEPELNTGQPLDPFESEPPVAAQAYPEGTAIDATSSNVWSEQAHNFTSVGSSSAEASASRTGNDALDGDPIFAAHRTQVHSAKADPFDAYDGTQPSTIELSSQEWLALNSVDDAVQAAEHRWEEAVRRSAEQAVADALERLGRGRRSF